MGQVQSSLSSITEGNNGPIFCVGLSREIPLQFDGDRYIGGNFEGLHLIFTIVPSVETGQCAHMHSVIERIIVRSFALVRNTSVVPSVGRQIDGLSLGCFEGQSMTSAFTTADTRPNAGMLTLAVVFKLQEPLHRPIRGVHTDPSLGEISLIILNGNEPYMILFVIFTSIKKLIGIIVGASKALCAPRIAKLH